MEEKKYTFLIKENDKEVLRFEHLDSYRAMIYVNMFCNKWFVGGKYELIEE